MRLSEASGPEAPSRTFGIVVVYFFKAIEEFGFEYDQVVLAKIESSLREGDARRRKEVS